MAPYFLLIFALSFIKLSFISFPASWNSCLLLSEWNAKSFVCCWPFLRSIGLLFEPLPSLSTRVSNMFSAHFELHWRMLYLKLLWNIQAIPMIKSFLVPFRHSLRRGIQYRNSLILTDIPRSANIYLQLNVFRNLEHCFMIIMHMPTLTLYMVIFLVQKRFYQVFIIFHYLYHFESFIITHDPSSNYLISFLLQLQRRRSMEFMIHKFIIIILKDVFFVIFFFSCSGADP